MTGLDARRTLWLGGALAAALIIFMPLRIAIDVAGLAARGLTARSVHGSVWSGTLDDARLGEVAFGDVHAGLAPLALLIGETRLTLRAQGDATFRGTIVNSLSSFGVTALTGDVPAGRIFAPLPVRQVHVDAVSARFTGRQCTAASGTVRVRMDDSIAGVDGLSLPQTMSGALHCAGDRLVVPLSSASATEKLTIRIAADGRYHADLLIQGDKPIPADTLAAIGFVETPAGYRLSTEGRF